MDARLVSGAILLIAVAGGWAVAYRSTAKSGYLKALLLIALTGLALRAYAAADFSLHPWDERYHALVARNLLWHPLTPTLYENPALETGNLSWLESHIWLHKPPMTLWLIAASLQLFGIHEIAVRVPSLLLSTFGVFLTFYAARYFIRPQAAVLAAWLYSVNGLLIDLAVGRSPTDHVDTVFAFFVELGACGGIYAVRRRTAPALLLVGIATGCAVLTKWLPGLLVIAVLFVLLLSVESWSAALRHSAIALGIAALVFIPWQIYTFAAFPKEAAWEAHFNNIRHLVEPLEGHGGSALYYVERLPRIFGEAMVIPLLWFGWRLYREGVSWKRAALVTWVALPYGFFSLAATKMPGYVMIAAPALFILVAEGFWQIEERRRRLRLNPILLAIQVLLLVLPIRYCYERVRPFRGFGRQVAWAEELKGLKGRVGEGKVAVFNVEHNIEAMFYSRIAAYPFVPDRTQVDRSIAQGFRVFIFDDPALTSDVRTNPGVVLLRHEQAN